MFCKINDMLIAVNRCIQELIKQDKRSTVKHKESGKEDQN